ncbi:MAG: cupin domain-containing protein [Acidimicrobiia bacterium]
MPAGPIRAIEREALEDGGARYLYYGEGCAIAARLTAPGSGSGPLVSATETTCFVVDGELAVDIEGATTVLGAGDVAWFPPGTPRRLTNPNATDAVHLEITAPGLPSGSDDRPASTESSARAFTRTPDLSAFSGTTFAQAWLVRREDGARSAQAYLADMPPHVSGPSLHYHEFDQFYFVLSGTLSVQVAMEHHQAGPGSLVALPARVPHAQRNLGDLPERHLALLVPQPEFAHTPETPWDVAVELGPGELHL